MRRAWLRRVAAVGSASLVAGLLTVVVGVSPASAGTSDGNCPFADTITATECQITQPWTVGGGGTGANNFPTALPGPYAFHKTLRIFAGGSINASTAGAPGITLNIDNTSGAAADSAGGTGQLLMDAGASVVDTSDVSGNDNAGAVTVTTTGGAQLAAGSVIFSENNSQAGNGGAISLTLGATSSLAGTITSRNTSATSGGVNGGDITIAVTGNLTLASTAVVQSNKINDSGKAGNIAVTVSGDMTMQGAGLAGAQILAKHPGASNGTPGGNITIHVGTGDLGTYTMQSGTLVDSGGAGFAGNIEITAGLKVDVQTGAKVLAGQRSEQDTLGKGGRIFVVSGCEARIFGTLSSQGQDPGADLVHVEGCEVHVGPEGLIESTGSAHQPARPASCDNVDDDNLSVGGAPLGPIGGSPGEQFRDHPDNSTVCVEIWARHVTIDAGGEVNADFALSGGTEGHGWIDIFSEQDITINGPVAAPFAVHSNSAPVPGANISNDTGGDVTVKAQKSFVSLTGLALQANATANGGRGGHVIVQAGGAALGQGPVLLDGSTIEARGSLGGGAPSGGIIEARSFQATLTGAAPGVLDASGDGGGSPGSIKLQSCQGTAYTGTSTPAAVTDPNDCNTNFPTFPAYVIFNPGNRWNRCGEIKITGTKTNFVSGAGLSGWTINLYGPGVGNPPVFNAAPDQTDVTDIAPNLGVYSFGNLAPGIYKICEVLQPGFAQDVPGAGVPCTGAGEAGNGYLVDTSQFLGQCCSGATITRDFANHATARDIVKTGKKFEDNAPFGTLGPEDTPLANWPINLLNAADDSLVTTTNTAADGSYTFLNINLGIYKVCEGVGPAGYTQSFPNAGTPNPVPVYDIVISTCPGPNAFGYQLTIDANTPGVLDKDDFGNRKDVVCQKPTAIDTMNLVYPGNKGPDVTVKTFAGDQVQTLVDGATDSNNDGYIIVMVIAHADGSLGGTANQKVLVTKDYGAKPFGLFGCSVTLTGGGTGPAVSIADTAKSGTNFKAYGRPTSIFVMDLHGGNSAVGVQAVGENRYLRNEYGTGNGTGIVVFGNNNTVHNGKGEGNTGNGVAVFGNLNLLTDTVAVSNGGDGFNVAGASNQLLKLTAGEKGTPNVGDGVEVNGNNNTLSEISAYKNGGAGIKVAGNANALSKNVAGDKDKGNGGDGIAVTGSGNTLTENKSNANTGNGFNVTGGTSNNVLKSNQSNTGSLENGGAEYRLQNMISNGGSNKADNTVVPKTSAPTKCNTAGTQFPSANGNFAAAQLCE